MALPTTFKKLMITKFSPNFREAVSIQSTPLTLPDGKNVLIKNSYVGVNADDINETSGRFQCEHKLPLGIGYEGLGEVVALGNEVKTLKVGEIVTYSSRHLNAYGEYAYVVEEETFAIPGIKPEYVALPNSGLVAAIGLDKSARVVDGETVLITAAAGGAGHIAVQWAKAAGCHVIGTCSTQTKADILTELGCDRVINYKTEDVDSILGKEYPNGVNVIWETMGGKFLQTCLKYIATKGRLLLIGGITGYRMGEVMPKIDASNLPELLFKKSAAIQGFSLVDFKECYQSYFNYLKERTAHEELRIILDNGLKSVGHEFIGLNGIFEAVEHLQNGANIGKVVVKIA